MARRLLILVLLVGAGLVPAAAMYAIRTSGQELAVVARADGDQVEPTQTQTPLTSTPTSAASTNEAAPVVVEAVRSPRATTSTVAAPQAGATATADDGAAPGPVAQADPARPLPGQETGPEVDSPSTGERPSGEAPQPGAAGDGPSDGVLLAVLIIATDGDLSAALDQGLVTQDDVEQALELMLAADGAGRGVTGEP